MSADTISNEDPGAGSPFGAFRPDPPLRSGARATALTTAVSLVLIGGVVTAAVRGSGHGTAPETLAPSTSFGFAQVDLGLADGQSNALTSFLGHFPDSPTKKGHGSLRDRLLAAMFKDSSDPHVDYTRDVKPWLGDRAAVAGWLDAQGKPQVEFLLRSTDDKKARESLHRLGPTLGVVFTRGYAVVGQTQALAQAAVTTAHKASLADDAHLHADLAKLSGAQVMTGWVDAGRARTALQHATHGLDPFSMMPRGMMPGLTTAQFKGRVVLGLHVTDTYAELAAQTFDAATTPTSGSLAPTSMLTGLPDATIGAAEVAGPGRLVTAAWGFVSGFFGVRQSFSSSASSATGVFGGPGAYGSTVQVCNTGANCPTITRSAPPTTLPIRSRPRPSVTQQVEKATGLKLPGDAVTLLGSSAVIAYGGLRTGGLPNVALVTRPEDLAAARALAEHSRDVIAQNNGFALAVGTTGHDLVVASSPTYEHVVESGGHLGSQARFAAAMGTLPDQVGFAAYVDLADIMPLVGHGQRDLDHLDALGVWAGRVGNDERLQLRLVVR
jgi:hypothetical protein